MLGAQDVTTWKVRFQHVIYNYFRDWNEETF